jgi:hypothetical protein
MKKIILIAGLLGSQIAFAVGTSTGGGEPTPTNKSIPPNQSGYGYMYNDGGKREYFREQEEKIKEMHQHLQAERENFREDRQQHREQREERREGRKQNAGQKPMNQGGQKMGQTH